MSIINKAQMRCKCGEKIHINVVTMLNITTHPMYWPNIYAGDLNSEICNNCGKRIYWPAPFIFVDMERKVILNVLMQPFTTGVYMLSHSVDFIQNFNDENVIAGLPDLTGYMAAAVMNLEDLKSKVHAKMAEIDIQELQFVEYILETKNSCEECGEKHLKFVYERSDNENHVFRTICLNCNRISMIEYPKESYSLLLEKAKQRIDVVSRADNHVNAG